MASFSTIVGENENKDNENLFYNITKFEQKFSLTRISCCTILVAMVTTGMYDMILSNGCHGDY